MNATLAEAEAALAQIGAARDRLLERVNQVLHADPRIDAAWLSGSIGRGEIDEWSDLDLHVAVADEHFEAVVENHAALFASVGRPLVTTGDGVPSDSVPGGRFWLVIYAPLLLEIDWSIGPTGHAQRPQTSRLLFDRAFDGAGIPVSPPPEAIDDSQRRATAQEQLRLFWCMVPIAIKYAGRGHTRLAAKHVGFLYVILAKLWYAVYHPELLKHDAYQQNRAIAASLDERLPRFETVIDNRAVFEMVLTLCREVESLHPELARLDATVDDGVVSELAVLSELAAKIIEAGGSSPDRGSRR